MRTRRRLLGPTGSTMDPHGDVPNRGSRTSEITDLILLEHIDVGFPTRGGRGQPHFRPYDLPARCAVDAPVAGERVDEQHPPPVHPVWGRCHDHGEIRTVVVDLDSEPVAHP